MNLHPGVEAYLRQILFVGLRRNGVNYAEARQCVYEKRVVEEFPSHFQTLFGQEWGAFIGTSPKLARLWDLFQNQARPIRNRVFHGLRDYDEEMFRLCFAIDLGLIEALGGRFLQEYGHDFLPPLKTLGLPRVGKQGISPSRLLKKLRSGKAPRYAGTREGLELLRQELDELEPGEVTREGGGVRDGGKRG